MDLCVSGDIVTTYAAQWVNAVPSRASKCTIQGYIKQAAAVLEPFVLFGTPRRSSLSLWWRSFQTTKLSTKPGSKEKLVIL